MAEDVRIIADIPNHGSRRHLDLFRRADNAFTVRFLDKDDVNIDVSGWAVRLAGKRHESDAAEIFDVSGTSLAVSGTVDFIVPVTSGADVFEVPGVAEFRWWTDANQANPPDGRHRMPLLIHREVGT